MYFGLTTYIEDCLHQGIIQWEGIARNVEYLGLSADLKLFLGQWYNRWLHPESSRVGSDDDDCDTVYSDSDEEEEDDDDEGSTTASNESVALDDHKDVDRGRTRTTRPLSISQERPLQIV